MHDLLRKLERANPALALLSVDDGGFGIYGRVLTAYNAGEMIERATAILPNMPDAVVYEPAVTALEAPCSFNTRIAQQVFGGMPVQVGWCYGHNLRMGALEYHKSNEVLVCLTDVVLLVGHIDDIVMADASPQEIVYNADDVEVFLAPAGAVIEFHPWCLHFAPIHARTDEGFATLVYLPKGTNEPLPFAPEQTGEGQLLFAVNKWLIAHADATELVEQGAYVGIFGSDITVEPI
jgi:hypothetical protein